MSRGNILICGDSYGLGEWSFDSIKPVHSGLQFYLEEVGYKVKNISMPGGSNIQAVNALSEEKLNDYLYIFWFQTDPLRCLRNFYKTSQFQQINSVSLMHEKSKELLFESYLALDKFKTPIHCIGGCYPLIEVINKYHNLKSCIRSVVELCYPSLTHIMWFSDWIDFIPKDFVDLDKLVEIKKKHDILYTEYVYEYFYPYTGHPNRKGHKLIFDTLNQQLGLTN